jgi:hypothetical protein
VPEESGLDPLVTTDELAIALKKTLAAIGAAQADLAVRLASGRVRDYTNQTLSLVENDVADLRGNWTGRLALPERPVISISEVKVIAGETEQVYGPAFRSLVGDQLVMVREGAIANASFRGGYWGGPASTVRVTYSHGFAVIPDGIKSIVLALAARQLDNPAGKQQEQLGDYGYRMAQGLALTKEEMLALDRYKRLR